MATTAKEVETSIKKMNAIDNKIKELEVKKNDKIQHWNFFVLCLVSACIKLYSLRSFPIG